MLTWVTTPTLLPLIPIPPRRHHVTTVSATSSPNNTTGLGQAVLTALESSPSTLSKQGPVQENVKVKPKGEETKGNELNGSDILWALQKATAKKAHKKVNKKNGSGVQLKKENPNRVVVDYDKVRPIIVKSDWVTRLDDLEKRLQVFTSI